MLFAQPTDVVKVRLQAGSNGRSVRYSSTLQAYKNIAAEEGTRGLWKGTIVQITIKIYDILYADSLQSSIWFPILIENKFHYDLNVRNVKKKILYACRIFETANKR